MSALPKFPTPLAIRKIYPDSDGKPMAENTIQFRWIVMIQGGMDSLFLDRHDVFVAGDLLWYAVEGDPTIRQAPDTMVVFGRPKGDRGSYRQWEEDGIAPQVVFEILSPGNRSGEMSRKLQFYEKYGVEEYYIYDPDEKRRTLEGYIRQNGNLEEIRQMGGWVSPRTGVCFDMSSDELQLIRPDGLRFLTFIELTNERNRERQRAEDEKKRAENEKKRAEDEKKRAEKLAAQLRALGVEPQS
jgi:Uma2 family endonuclease